MMVQQIGPYRVLRPLGVGGCGTVYEAVHAQLGRRAAVKVLHADIASDPVMTTRFLNEARAISQVEHPGVVSILEMGQQADGSPYIAMELLQGQRLTERLGHLSCPDALQIARQIAATLAAAHHKGIVHRDLKPDNIMIVPDAAAQGGERVKVLDFGIAKLTEGYDGPGAQALKTRTGITMGTPAYMSPEQCRGARTIDGKSDVYTLGVMLYEMLAGKAPFSARGDGELMAMHIYQAPRSLRVASPGLPEPVAALVHAMLTKAAEERPTMAEASRRIGQLLAAEQHTAAMQRDEDGAALRTERELPVDHEEQVPTRAGAPRTPPEVRAVSSPAQRSSPEASRTAAPDAPTRLVLMASRGRDASPPATTAAPPAAAAGSPPAAEPAAPRPRTLRAIAMLLAGGALALLALVFFTLGHRAGRGEQRSAPVADGPRAPAPSPPPATPASRPLARPVTPVTPAAPVARPKRPLRPLPARREPLPIVE